jgi:hypothetical protein
MAEEVRGCAPEQRGESPQEHGVDELVVLLEVALAQFSEDDAPHVLLEAASVAQRLLEVDQLLLPPQAKPIGTRSVGAIRDGGDWVLLLARSDLDWILVQDSALEAHGLVNTEPIGELLSGEGVTMVTYFEFSFLSTLRTGPALPKNRVR